MSCLVVLTTLGDEFGQDSLDWLSSIFAIFYSLLCFPLLLHQLYVNLFYFPILEEPSMKLAYGHYYVDVKTNSRFKSIMHILFSIRRVIFVYLVLFFGHRPEVTLMIMSFLSLGYMIYVG